MRIEITTTFLDGRERYTAGDLRVVSDEDGQRFIENGWAKDPAGPEPKSKASKSTTLDVHSLSSKQVISHG